MDEYGQTGPDKPGYFDDVQAIGRKLARLGYVDVYFSARGTTKHVVLVLLPAPGEVMAAEQPHFGPRPEGFREQPGIFVGINNGKAAWLPARGDLHPAYIRGSLGESFGVDDRGEDALSAFINQVSQVIYGAAVAGGLL